MAVQSSILVPKRIARASTRLTRYFDWRATSLFFQGSVKQVETGVSFNTRTAKFVIAYGRRRVEKQN